MGHCSVIMYDRGCVSAGLVAFCMSGLGSCRKAGLAFMLLAQCSQSHGQAGAGGNRTDLTLVPWARLSEL